MMKRNESILVSGVTGLLLVILFVAVFFGNEGPSRVQPDELTQGPAGESSARTLSDLLNLDPAAPLDPQASEPQPSGAGAPVASAAADGQAPAPGELSATESPADGPAAPGPADAALGEAGQAGAAYALTTRVGSFREVTVRPGDTFSTLVQHWCGSLEHLAVAEALNEDVDQHNLTAGRKLLLPWVEDTVLESARKERRVVEQKREAASGQTYSVRDGDSLWKIAVQATGSDGRAPAFIARLLELNPGLVPEKIRVGQQIVLPPP